MVDWLFHILAFFVLGSACLVITAKNAVHAVLFLMFAFFNAAALFILIGAEYIAMTLVIVYVGAVAVLFMFVVMMLDLELSKIQQGLKRYYPISILLSLLIFVNLYFAINMSKGDIQKPGAELAHNITNTEMIGRALYTDYLLAFQISGLILFVAMVGAIMLTLFHKKIKRQDICQQVARKREQAVKIVKVDSGKGVSI